MMSFVPEIQCEKVIRPALGTTLLLKPRARTRGSLGTWTPDGLYSLENPRIATITSSKTTYECNCSKRRVQAFSIRSITVLLPEKVTSYRQPFKPLNIANVHIPH